MQDELRQDDLHVEHVPERSRVVASLDGREVGFMSYRREGDALVIDHTIVDASVQGRGIASALVRAGLDMLAGSSDVRIVPECSYVRSWLARHPDYLH